MAQYHNAIKQRLNAKQIGINKTANYELQPISDNINYLICKIES